MSNALQRDLILWDRRRIVNRIISRMNARRMKRDRLLELLGPLKAGSEDAKAEIIFGHVGLAVSCAAKYSTVYSNRRGDLVACALEALVDCVERVRSGVKILEDEHLDWYIGAYIKGKLKTFLRHDQLIKPPDERDPEKRLLHSYFGLPSIDQYFENNETDTRALTGLSQTDLRKLMTNVRDHHVFMLIKDVLSSKRLTSREKKILELHYLGYTDEEIAPVVGIQRSRITQLKLGAFKIIKQQYEERDV